MRAKIMRLHFALLLLLLDPIVGFDLQKEMGSRSMDLLGNASVSDFRFARSIHKVVSASLLAPDADSLWKDSARKKVTKLNGNSPRIKRSDDLWIKSEIDVADDFLKIHAFVVRDEHIPECDTPADKVTESRYFMCSGVILDENHVLTSATCVNQAHIHEYHIEADLAVLIGALDKNSYIIKIAHYEIHPRYVPDPNSIHHATNNIALLRLSCSIPRKYFIVPKLPTKRFEDIAHLCCPNKCKLSTVIENSENQHFVRLMKLKHLPSPMHIDVRNSNDSNKKTYMSSSYGIVKQETIKDELLPEILRRSIRQRISDDTKTTNLMNSSKNSDSVDVITSIIDNSSGNRKRNNKKKSVNHFLEEDDGAIDWEKVKMEINAAKVSEKNQKLLSDFVQNSVSDIMTKLLEVVTHHIADMNNVFSYFQNVLREEFLRSKDLNPKLSDFIGRDVLKFALNEMSLISDSNVINCTENCSKCITLDNVNIKSHLENKKSETTVATRYELHTRPTSEAIKANKGEGSNKINKVVQQNEKLLLNKDKEAILTDNVFCPPLGSPVMANNTLVALIAYTCNDVQNWVEWKYVNIVQNIRWIRKELNRNLTEIIKDSDSPNVNHKK